MNYITGQDRHQMSFGNPAEEMGLDNSVHFIDAFVDKIDLFQLGFEVKPLKEEGCPPLAPASRS
jgi:hypothetical protein